VTTPRPSRPTTYEGYFAEKYNNAQRDLKSASELVAKKTADLAWLKKELDGAEEWLEESLEVVEALER
jgi:hypothetical protein